MKEDTKLQHVALQQVDQEKADIFFKKILGLELVKTFTLDRRLSEEIFGIPEPVEAVVYGNEQTHFEIFITKTKNIPGFCHTCIEINNKEDFIKHCKENNIEPFFIKKDDRTLLFVKDFSKNLFEIKEK